MPLKVAKFNKSSKTKSKIKSKSKRLFIISLGGSLICPNELDVPFLRSFRQIILKRVNRGDRFVLVAGGGHLARKYLEALRSVVRPSVDTLDWMGIHSTRLNAQLIRLLFGKLAHPKIVEDPNKKVTFKEKILVAGGWKPGRSTDDDAVRMAQVYGAHAIINLSNVDYVYTKDPRKFKDARPIKQISWKDFRKIVGSKWDPGKNAPFDPVAAKFAQAHKQKVIIARGNNLKNLERILAGRTFVGTVII